MSTGKTDTAVQIISELYHNFPEQRTLLITHSNNALNDLFEKIMQRDIGEQYLLRLGRGSEELASESDMGKFGRVNHMLARRLTLLEEVATLARSMEMSDDVAYTCETSGHFFLAHILARWEKFSHAVAQLQKQHAASSAGAAAASTAAEEHHRFVTESFPFTRYFNDREQKRAQTQQQYQNAHLAQQQIDEPMDVSDSSAAHAASSAFPSSPATGAPLFPSASLSTNLSIALGCFASLQKLFVELEECRPFELLRSYKDRSNYLLTKHAKIIAMTCTHAGIKRSEMIGLDFHYDNIVMEESAQILEIETFIPMLLQRDSGAGSRLKRIILLGDHHQLPPVIKNRAFQKYSHMDQSMFTRFIRLGLPYIQLNAQGRMRASLATLWNWQYDSLGNLPSVQRLPAYTLANVGFRHEYQVVNVEDLNGVGESTPQPYFYQNIAEAEYIVQTYMYMRLLGYPAENITILTTYNGQKHLIRDVLQQRCGTNLLFGMPHKVATVDKYQGQQNDCKYKRADVHRSCSASVLMRGILAR
jgi:intron-binding protein aquarius